MSRELQATNRCKTFVLDRSLSQLSAVKATYPDAKIVLCRFHILRDFKKRCGHLRSNSRHSNIKLLQWMRGLVYTTSERQFDALLTAIASASPEVFRYLTTTWLPYKQHWVGYMLKDVRILGNMTTNRVESANRYLKEGLTQRSSVVQLFSAVLQRVRDADRTREIRLGRSFTAAPRLTKNLRWAAAMFRCISPFARNVVKKQLSTENVAHVRYMLGGWSVITGRGRTYTVTMVGSPSCGCTFSMQWDLPCPHVMHVCRLTRYPLESVIASSRWFLQKVGTSATAVRPANTSVSLVLTSPVTAIAGAKKLSASEEAGKDLSVVLANLSDSNFSMQLSGIRRLTEELGRRPDVIVLCKDRHTGELMQLTAGSAAPTPAMVPVAAQVTSNPTSETLTHSLPSTQDALNAPRSRRKCQLLTRNTDVEDICIINDPLTNVRFRALSNTSLNFRKDAKRRRVDVIQPAINNDACFICQRRMPVSVDLDAHIVQCQNCRMRCHQACAGDFDGSDHTTCVRCMSIE